MPTTSAMDNNNSNTIHILCTRPLTTLLEDELQAAGIQTDILSFIETTPVDTVEAQQEIEQAYLLSGSVVFTSMNAVEAVAAWKDDQQPDWNIYCIGTATKKLVEEHFGSESIAGTANTAAELAELIVEENETGQVIFFCGDQRRDELPEILQEHGIEVNEIIVYQTVALPHKIAKHYNGILFFSPSAVHSFFVNNKVQAQTILFAIGKTTASTIKKYSNHTIIISKEPGKENLVQLVVEYFCNG
ncbi:MAG: uroporphyrinogen-III synthase [Bacteroidetes bacterium]|nr:uroporphyrinogen-III synthase [Bacteroidota bacterium]